MAVAYRRPVQSFVAGLDGDADRSIVEAVIALAHGLRIEVVAEGIETEAQFHLLREMGCDVGQGYLFARPLPAAEASRLLAPGRSSGATRAHVLAPAPAPAIRPRAAARTRPSRTRPRPATRGNVR